MSSNLGQRDADSCQPRPRDPRPEMPRPMPEGPLPVEDVPRLMPLLFDPPTLTYEEDDALGTLPPTPVLPPRAEVGLDCFAAMSAFRFSSSSTIFAAVLFFSCSSASLLSAARCFSMASSSISAMS